MMIAALLLLAAAPLPAAIPNPGFEQGLVGWTGDGHRGYLAHSTYPRGGGPRRLSMAWAARSMPPAGARFRVSTRIDARPYRGRRIRVSASVRAYGRPGGAASIFARAGATEAAMPIPRDVEWRREGVDLAVPRDAREIVLGFHIERPGMRIEADDVLLEVLR
jgi:hypothetical protein